MRSTTSPAGTLPWLATWLLVGLAGVACSATPATSSSGGSGDTAQTQDTGSADVATADDANASADDAGSGDASAADAADAAGAADSAQPDVPAAAPYDFTAHAPWYSCDGEALPKEAVVVDAFVQADQSFGKEDKRQIAMDVAFPTSGSWGQVALEFKLECPASGLCDHWDRAGSVQLVLNPEAPVAEQQSVEIARHVTPYRMGMCQYIDITGLAPLLKGKRRLTSFIDTWVGPGHNQGEGWRVSTRFVFYPGPAATPTQVVNVWGRRSITVGEIEADKNVDAQVEPFVFTPPASATKVVAHLITTGHSFGNTGNCAEFCKMRHDLLVNGTTYSHTPWRADCGKNPVANQLGTWTYARNGWCPGSIVVGELFDITGALAMGKINTLDFDILLGNGVAYDNVKPVDLLPYTLVSLKLYVYE